MKSFILPQTRRLLLARGPLPATMSAIVLAVCAGQARAADTPAPAEDAVVQEVIVSGSRDLIGVIQTRSSTTTFGLDKPLVETPRSVTAISDELLSRYNIKSVYDFTAVAAGTYTGSYFGVPGSLNVRGTVADNYFNGFLTISNFANYPTPVDASSSIEIVRGPASPVSGAGQIGGFLNFRPKSARGMDAKYLGEPTGKVTATIGSYSEKEATAEIGMPLKLGANNAGLYLFGEVVDSKSFYIGQKPKTQVAQATFTTDLGPGLTFDATVQYIHASGYLKNIGWNRVTQDLIDNSNYISGSPVASIVEPGAAMITKDRFFAVTGGSTISYVLPIFGVTGTVNDFTRLDPATIRTVKLSPRTTFLDPTYDINSASTPSAYLGLTKAFDDGSSLKLESFTQRLSSRNYQSYGFSTVFKTTVSEERLSYHLERELGDALRFQATAGGSFRYSTATSKSSLNAFAISQDRRDLSVGPTADDRFNDPFLVDDYAWDTDIRSHQKTLGGFLVADALLFSHLDLLAGVRIDHYSLSSVDQGLAPDGDNVVSGTKYRATSSPVSYNVSVSYKNPIATPYFTYAKSRSINLDQGGAIQPQLITGGNFLGASSLIEAGLKTSQFNGRLYAAIDLFRQKNQFLDAFNGGINGQRSQGFEAELRYLATSRLGITGTATLQTIRQLAAGDGSGAFITLPPALAGVAPTDGFGGFYASNAVFMGLGGGYALHTVPRATFSLFGTWDEHGKWGLTGGVVYNSWTGGYLPGSIRLPSYVLVKAGAYVVVKGVRIDAYADNLFDKRYFMAEYDVDANATVLPGVGRTLHVKLSHSF